MGHINNTRKSTLLLEHGGRRDWFDLHPCVGKVQPQEEEEEDHIVLATETEVGYSEYEAAVLNRRPLLATHKS